MSNSHSTNKIKNVTGIRNFSDVFSHVLSKAGILSFHADGFADECEPLPTWQFPSQQKWAEKTRLTRLDKKQEIKYNKKEHSGKWVTVPSALSFFTCLNVLFVLVAGARFELTTFGLWARRATELLHPAIFCRITHAAFIVYHTFKVMSTHNLIF